MSITIGDALLHLGVDSSELDTGMKKSVDNIKSQMKAVGAAMTGFGVAITGSLTLAVKAAADEEAGVIKLSQALKNVGVAYDDVKDSLEATIDATQQKTAMADDKQRAALANLVGITDDYRKSLELLPLALDLAAAKGMDLVAASDIIGRVSMGNTTILSRYGLELKEGATATEALAALQAKYGGQAEAYGASVAGQFELIKNNIGDVVEAIGGTLLPTINDLFKNSINPLIQDMKAWTAEHPELTKQIVVLAGVVGGFAAVLGPILIMLPALIASFPLLFGPIGLVALAIMGLVAAGTALYLNWDKVKYFFQVAWQEMKIAVLTSIEGILAALERFTSFIPVVGDKVREAREKISGMIDAEELEEASIRAHRVMAMHAADIEKMTEAAGTATVATDGLTSAVNENTDAVEENRKKIEEAEKAYETLTDKVKSAIEQFSYERSEAGKLRITIDDVISSLHLLGWTNEQITQTLSSLGEEGDNVNAVLNRVGLSAARVSEILGEQKKTVDELNDSMKSLSGTYSGFQLPPGMVLPELQRALDMIKPGMADVSVGRGTTVLSYLTLLLKTPANELAAGVMGGWESVLGKYLTEEALENLRQWFQAMRVGGSAPGSPIATAPPAPSIAAMQYGGVISEPTLLTRIRGMVPYAIAGERGREVVSPAGAGINFTINVAELHVREEADVDRIGEAMVTKLRLMGIKGK